MWFAIIITVIAAAGNNIGKALQKQATRNLPKLTLKQDVLAQYIQNTTWVVGLSADVAGALLMIVAFAFAPVSVVQPVSGIGLIFLVIFSHFYLKERLRAWEWFAAFLALLGIAGLGFSSEPDHSDHSHVSATWIAGTFVILLSFLGVECFWRQQVHWQRLSRMHMGASSQLLQSDAVFCGLEAGACFGFSAAACRTGFMLAEKKVSMAAIPVGLALSVALTSSGFLLQTRGFKSGNAVVVCTMAAVSSMVSGIVVGLVALGEKLPSTGHLQVVRFSSWLLLLIGIGSMSGGAGGALEVVRMMLGQLRLPPWAWALLPRPLALAVHKLSKAMEPDTIPTTSPANPLGSPHLSKV